jgi:hypothetical protein
MDDAYYIILTVIFGLFVLFIMWWLFQYIKGKDSVTSTLKWDPSPRDFGE